MGPRMTLERSRRDGRTRRQRLKALLDRLNARALAGDAPRGVIRRRIERYLTVWRLYRRELLDPRTTEPTDG
jgi:hypothetical protein